MRYVTHSADETRALAAKLLPTLKKGSVICLDGEMGTGKTVFVQGCMKALGYNDRVTSPTFTVCCEYFCSLHVLHYDLYRVNDADDLYSTGFYDSNADLVFAEWAGTYCDAFDGATHIRFYYSETENERIIETED